MVCETYRWPLLCELSLWNASSAECLLTASTQGRAPPEAAIPQEPPSVSSPPPTAGLPARVAAKPSLNLLDFDGESSAPPLQQQQQQQEQPAPAGVHPSEFSCLRESQHQV